MNFTALRKTIITKLNDIEKLRQSRNKHDQRWAELINAYIMNNNNKGHDELIRLRYEEHKEVDEILPILFIERTTYYQWEKEIIWNIALLAAYNRLLKLNWGEAGTG